MHAFNRMGCMRAARSPAITMCCAVAMHPTYSLAVRFQALRCQPACQCTNLVHRQWLSSCHQALPRPDGSWALMQPI